jgi:Spy/CpxP family protein refolding chaperone
MPSKNLRLLSSLFCLCLCMQTVAAQSQGGRPSPARARRMAPITAQTGSGSLPTDDFAGLNFTEDQKAKIDEIHRKMNSNREIVAKAETLTSDAKNAMIQGYSRIERSQIFDVLTPDQQKEVRARIHARQAAAPAEKKQVSPPLK